MKKFLVIFLFIIFTTTFVANATSPEYYEGYFRGYTSSYFKVDDKDFAYSDELIVIKFIAGAQALFEEQVNISNVRTGDKVNVIYYGNYATQMYVGVE